MKQQWLFFVHSHLENVSSLTRSRRNMVNSCFRESLFFSPRLIRLYPSPTDNIETTVPSRSPKKQKPKPRPNSIYPFQSNHPKGSRDSLLNFHPFVISQIRSPTLGLVHATKVGLFICYWSVIHIFEVAKISDLFSGNWRPRTVKVKKKLHFKRSKEIRTLHSFIDPRHSSEYQLLYEVVMAS